MTKREEKRVKHLWHIHQHIMELVGTTSDQDFRTDVLMVANIFHHYIQADEQYGDRCRFVLSVVPYDDESLQVWKDLMMATYDEFKDKKAE
jgi:hypothetical protein